MLVGSALLLLGVANPLDAWKLGMVDGLVRVAFLPLGVGALLLGVTFLLDRWTLVGVAFLLFGVAALLGGVAALLDGWTLVGVALLLGPVTVLLLGVAFLLFGVAFFLGGAAALLHGWTLVGVPFLLLGVAALLGGVAALLDGWTLVVVPFLLLGIAALLGGVALLYRPELPRRLVAWLTHEAICRSRRTVTTGISSLHVTQKAPRLGITKKSRMGTPAAGPARLYKGSEDPDLDGSIGTRMRLTSTDAGMATESCVGNP